MPGLPEADPDWGEPGLSKAEKIFAWTSVIVLAFRNGTPERPVNAVQGEARARLQIRHTGDERAESVQEALRRHLDEKGCDDVAIEPRGERDGIKETRSEGEASW